MMDQARLALFVMLGQGAERAVQGLPDTVPAESLSLGPNYDVAALLPSAVRASAAAAEGYRLFFVFEAYLRDLVVDLLSSEGTRNWWDRVPKDVQEEVEKLEATEEIKRWMALASRDKSALLTYPQLLRIIEQTWKEGFDELLRDRGLVQEAKLIAHLRNTLCHMTPISDEEMERVRQVMRDWFRVVGP